MRHWVRDGVSGMGPVTLASAFERHAEISRPHAMRLPPVATTLGPIALTVTSDVKSLKRRWTALETIASSSAAQTHSYAEAWARLVLAPSGREPLIVIGTGADGNDLFLWALEIESNYGMKVLKWLGESHASYAMGLFHPEAAPRLCAKDMEALLGSVASHAGAAAAFLRAQPYDWGGVVNPFAKLQGQPAASDGYALRLGDFAEIDRRRRSKSTRAKAARKQRKLAEFGGVEFGWAKGEPERTALIETLFTQKARQLAELGVRNPFTPEVRAFYRKMALLPDHDPARLRLGSLKVNGIVAATHSGFLCHRRLEIALSSMAAGDIQRQSPGALLLKAQIEEACADGMHVYDLGAGAGPNKDEWCDIVQPLFDSYIAFKPQGLLLMAKAATAASIKRAIKSNRHFWPFVQRWRMRLFGRTGALS